jgi:PIN domain nuclease of toxin-antitoxin system
MKLLLDTHIWLWSQLEPERLSRRVMRALIDPSNEIWLSSISVWETLMLCRKGRLSLDPDPAAWVTAALAKAPVREAPLTHDVALAVEAIELSHRDPADRFLAASAKVFGLTLVTADEYLIRGKGYTVLANRGTQAAK